jgi:hypothetical protein
MVSSNIPRQVIQCPVTSRSVTQGRHRVITFSEQVDEDRRSKFSLGTINGMSVFKEPLVQCPVQDPKFRGSKRHF